MSSADKILAIVSSRHPASFTWRNFPDWHRERLLALIQIDTLPKLKHLIDILILERFNEELNTFWDYRGPNLSLIRTDSVSLVEHHHFQPVQVTSHNFESVRRTHQSEVYECLCKRQLSFRLKTENPCLLRLKTYFAGIYIEDIRESIEKTMVKLLRQLT